MKRFVGNRQRRRPYSLDIPDGISDADRGERITAFVLAHFPYVHTYACDIPSTVAYPEAVLPGVEYLRSLPGTKIDREGYGTTGELDIEDERAWVSFASVAPYVYDAYALGNDGVYLRIEDEGYSAVTRLREDSATMRDLGSRFPLRQS